MKVLFLPYNLASDISHKIVALRGHGVDAKGLVIDQSRIQTVKHVKVLESAVESRFENRRRMIKNLWTIGQAFRWADVIHWTCLMGVLPRRLDEAIVNHFDKPRVVQWYGSDIRNPEIECRINPYYAEARASNYEYDHESADFSHSTQEKFARLGFYPVEFPEMMHYVRSELFPSRFTTRQMVNLDDHPVSLPEPANRRPVVVHSPSAPVAKGTRFVLEAVESLKGKFDFEFVLVENMAREKALEVMRRCDVFVDQLILGAHGYAAVEAMAFGKPVVCYINPQTAKAYPRDLPIVNANPENIVEVLGGLLQDGTQRCEIGRGSRDYVEKYHDGQKVAGDLLEIYKTVIRLHKDRLANV